MLQSASSQPTWTPIATVIVCDLCLDVARSYTAYHTHLVDGYGALNSCLLLHRGGTYAGIVCDHLCRRLTDCLALQISISTMSSALYSAVPNALTGPNYLEWA